MLDPHYEMLPNGRILFFGDGIPGAQDSAIAFQPGDLLLVLSSTAGKPALYRCTTASTPGTNGGMWEEAAAGAMTVKTATADYTATLDDDLILVDESAKAVTVTLPEPATCKGKPFTVKQITNGGNGTTVVFGAAGKLDGAANKALTQWKYITAVSNGTDGLIVADNL